VEGEGPEGVGGVFICEGCAELALSIVKEEKRLRGASEEQGETAKVTVRRPTLTHLQQLVRQSIAEHKGTLPKESALVWFGYFASLLTWELLSVEDYCALLELLPDYPDDPEVQRILGRSSATPGGS
jgi:hypothetical protein